MSSHNWDRFQLTLLSSFHTLYLVNITGLTALYKLATSIETFKLLQRV